MSLDRAVEAAAEELEAEGEPNEWLHNARIAIEAAAPYLVTPIPSLTRAWERIDEERDRAERAEAEVERLREALNEQAQRWASEVERVTDRNPQPTDGRGDG